MGKYRKLGVNTFFVFLGNAGGKALSILMLPLYTRWLSVGDFGISDMIMAYSTLLFGIASLSICESVFVFPKGQNKKAQSEYYTSGLLYTLIVFIAIGLLLYLFGVIGICTSENVLIKYRWYIYLVIFAMYIENYQQQFTRCIDKIKIYSFAGIIQSFCIIIFSVIWIPSYGVWGYVLSWAASYFLTGIYSFVLSGSYGYLVVSNVKWLRYKEMLKYSLPLIPNSMMFWLMNSMNRPVMESYLGVDSVGIYALANKFPAVLTVLFNVFLLSWQISVLDEFKKSDFEKFFNQIFRIVLLFLGVVFLTISLCNHFIVYTMATPEYYEAWKYISLLTFGSLVFALSSFVGTNFIASRESKYFFYSSVGGAFIAVIFNYLLIPICGLYGAAISILLSSSTMLCLRIYYAEKHVKLLYKKSIGLTLLLFLAISFCFLLESTWCYSLIVFFISIIFFINRKSILGVKSALKTLKK